MLHQDYSLQTAQSSVSKWELLLLNHSILLFLPCKHSHKFFHLDSQRISKCHGATCHLFQDFLPLKLHHRLYFPFFFPREMLTHSRENIWRLILAQEQSKGKMGRGSLQLEGLKILAIKKKNLKPKPPGFMSIQQLLLLLLAGWILPKIKPQMLFSTWLKKQDPISCLLSGNHIIPTFLEGMAKSEGGVSLGRTRFSGMLVAGGKSDALDIPHYNKPLK